MLENHCVATEPGLSIINPTCPPPLPSASNKNHKTTTQPCLESSGFQFLARRRVLHGKLKCLNGHVLGTFHEAMLPNDRLWHCWRLLGIQELPKLAVGATEAKLAEAGTTSSGVSELPLLVAVQGL